MTSTKPKTLIVLLGHTSSGKTSVMGELEKGGRAGMSIDRLVEAEKSKNYPRMFRLLGDWALAHPTGVIETTGTSPATVDLLHRLRGDKVDFHVFSLRCSLKEYEAREAKRADRPALDHAPWYRPIYGMLTATHIVTTDKTPKQVTEEIEACLIP